ncbi:transglutaminase-like cysteine peptidase [Methylotuvimicrobium sp. KM2]|uniref:transglutaminase-like cysteine peptidase n=1 Tax=Methylotuvimicrobium sp. KM2 TaxID=3133976 RepID=UPI0031014F9B
MTIKVLRQCRLVRSICLLLGLCLSLFSAAQIDISTELLSRVENKYGVDGRLRVEAWKQLLEDPDIKILSVREKLEKVNDFFNQNIDFVDDIFLWGVEDYWATPVEFLAQGAGDCEDYSIAKYFTLKILGVPDDKLRITYVKAVELGQAHMVLTYFETPRSVPLVLDNIISQIKLATERKDLIPVYSFNGSGLWLAKARGSGQRVGGSQRLSLWTDLTNRMLQGSL